MEMVLNSSNQFLKSEENGRRDKTEYTLCYFFIVKTIILFPATVSQIILNNF